MHNNVAFAGLVLACPDLDDLQPLVDIVAHLVDCFYIGPTVAVNLKLIDHFVLHGRKNLSLL